MKYEELKEKIYALTDSNTRLYYIAIFEQYEKENQAIAVKPLDKSEHDSLLKEINSMNNVRYEMQKEIETLKTNNKLQHDAIVAEINSVNKKIDSFVLDKFKEKPDIEKEIFELSCFRKKFGECLDDQRNDLNLLKKHILDLQDELGTLKRDLKFEKEQEKPKKERFYSEHLGGGNFQVLDAKLKCCFDLEYTLEESIEICKALNQMEGGK